LLLITENEVSVSNLQQVVVVVVIVAAAVDDVDDGSIDSDCDDGGSVEGVVESDRCLSQCTLPACTLHNTARTKSKATAQ
jgi:hypothetical protein